VRASSYPIAIIDVDASQGASHVIADRNHDRERRRSFSHIFRSSRFVKPRSNVRNQFRNVRVCNTFTVTEFHETPTYHGCLTNEESGTEVRDTCRVTVCIQEVSGASCETATGKRTHSRVTITRLRTTDTIGECTRVSWRLLLQWKLRSAARTRPTNARK